MKKEKIEHDWVWEAAWYKYPGGNAARRPIPVDQWRCRICGESKTTQTGEPPRRGYCK